MLPIIANATAADWRAFTAAIVRDAIAHGIPADLAEDVAQAAALRLLKRTRPLPTPRDGQEARGLAFPTALLKGQGRRYGYRSFLPRDAGQQAKDPDEAVQVANRRASRHVPDPSVIAEKAERPARIADDAPVTARHRRRMLDAQKGDGFVDSTAILAAYGVGPQALAEPGWTPDVAADLGHQQPRLTRGVPAQDGDGTAVRTLPYDAATEWAKAEGNRLARAERVAEDRPWWMS